jgi:hypothetical protein
MRSIQKYIARVEREGISRYSLVNNMIKLLIYTRNYSLVNNTIKLLIYTHKYTYLQNINRRRVLAHDVQETF